MDNEKERGSVGGYMQDDEKHDGHGNRARNRTVMLTPEITNQVRNRFQQEAETAPMSAPTQHSVAPQSGGFFTPTGTGRVQTPAVPAPTPTTQHHVAPQSNGEGVYWSKPSKVVGFMVSYDKDPNGWVCELRVGRLIVSNQASPTDNTMVLEDDSVSSMHAIIRVGSKGDVQILDQLSESGTRIKRFDSEEEEVLSGERATISHGDTVTFGQRKFYIMLMPITVTE